MIILGLGSNIGDRLGHLSEAVGKLAPMLSQVRLSRVLESPAMLPPGAPEEWNKPYLNMALSARCTLSPQELLAEIKSIEKQMGRVADKAWGPRQIDIDILAVDDVVLETPQLTIPHQGMVKRAFVLFPVSDVAPEWQYPTGKYKGLTASEIIAAQGFVLGETLKDSGLKIHG